MTEVPAAVQVGPYRFDVLVDDEAHARAVRNNNGDVYGYTEYREQRITIDPNQSADHIRVTLVHELLHAVCHATGADQLLDDVDSGAEERLIQILAPALDDLLHRNDELVAYLTA